MKLLNSKIDWKWLIPKLLFAIPVLGVALFGAFTVIRNAISKQPLFPYDAAEITLFLITIWLTSEAVEILLNNLNNPVEKAVNQSFVSVLPHLHYTSVQTTPEEAYHELQKAYEIARESINIISWKELRIHAKDKYKQKYYDTLRERLKSKSKPWVTYRRLIWMPEHLSVVEEWASLYNEIPSTEFRFFIPQKGDETPVLPCVIVDERIVNFGWGYLGRPHLDEVNITLMQHEAVQAFMEYFAYLWQNSIVIKERGEPINIDVISKIRAQINITGIP